MNSQNLSAVAERPQLAQTVFSILDSRIQFLEHQLESNFDPKKINPIKKISFLQNYENLMAQYAKVSKALKQLHILKEWVKAENASLILSLLNNESYMSYQENQLEEMIRPVSRIF